MSKSTRSSLDLSTLGSVAGQTHNPVDVLETKKAGRARSRIGKKHVGGYLEPTYHKTLKMLSAREGRTVEDLLQEGLNDMFTKYVIELS